MSEIPRRYTHNIMLNEHEHGHMWETRPDIGYPRPTPETRAELDRLVGVRNWIYQSIFANDVDQDRMLLWFSDEASMIAVRFWLCDQVDKICKP